MIQVFTYAAYKKNTMLLVQSTLELAGIIYESINYLLL